MRILGIDPGSRVLGYAVVECDGARRLRYLECGVLEADARAPIERRLGDIARALAEIIDELRPDTAAAEEVFSAINVRSALALGQARGAVLAVCGRAELRVWGYAPAVVKQAVTGRGRAPKGQVARMVQVLLGLKREPRAGAADALAVAIAHAHIRKDLATDRRRA